jgi:hypothetical protein
MLEQGVVSLDAAAVQLPSNAAPSMRLRVGGRVYTHADSMLLQLEQLLLGQQPGAGGPAPGAPCQALISWGSRRASRPARTRQLLRPPHRTPASPPNPRTPAGAPHAAAQLGPQTAQQQPAAAAPQQPPPSCAPSICPLPQAPISVGHSGDLLDCHPALVQMWGAAGLEPYSRPKAAAYLALCPEGLSAQVASLMHNVSAAYQACRLGSLWPAQVPQALQAHLATAAAAAACSELPRLPLLPPAGMAVLRGGVVALQPVPGSSAAAAAAGSKAQHQQQQQQQGAAESAAAGAQQQQQQHGWYAQAVREAAQQLRRALSSQQQPLRWGARPPDMLPAGCSVPSMPCKCTSPTRLCCPAHLGCWR